MLDAKRTFDALIERLAPDARTRDEVLANRIYQQLSNAVAGSQEFTAIAKLYELDQEGGFDLLVLDTPPSRNALDFLDAPAAADGLLPGPRDPDVPAPGRARRAVLGRGTGVVFGVLRARDRRRPARRTCRSFFRALGGMIDGFTERAPSASPRCSQDPGDDVPDRHLAAPRPGRGGDLLPPQAARRRHAVRRAGGQPRARAPPEPTAPLPTGARRRARRRTSPRRVAASGARAGRARRARRRATSATCARGSATRRRSSCPSWTTTCTTSRASRTSRAPVRRLPAPAR